MGRRRGSSPGVDGLELPMQPMAEVFGFRLGDFLPEAVRYRSHRLCPFHNKVPNCTKDRAEDPLGVCSVYGSNGEVTITCPVRFREDWLIATDAASFFFPLGTLWTSLTEVRLPDANGQSAGNIDVVLVAYDEKGRIIDYGALEVQAVYISGNIRRAFQFYMDDPVAHSTMDWRGQTNYPRPDFLSSSRKRLAPQLIFKGGILNTWQRKMAVALDRAFFNTLPALTEVDKTEAEMAWMVYDLTPDVSSGRLRLNLQKTVFTLFEPALLRLTRSEAGDERTFLKRLQVSLDIKLGGSAPDTTTTTDAPF